MQISLKQKTYAEIIFQNRGRSQLEFAEKCVPFSKFHLKTFRRFSPMPTAKKTTKCVPFSGNTYKYFSQHRKKGTHCVPFLENHFSDLNTKNKTYRDRLLFRNHCRSQFRSAAKCVPFSKFRLKTFCRFSPLSPTFPPMPTAKKRRTPYPF